MLTPAAGVDVKKVLVNNKEVMWKSEHLYLDDIGECRQAFKGHIRMPWIQHLG